MQLLRGGGLDTIAKTTGTNPRIILEHHKEVPILRLNNANIIEQVKVINYVANKKPQALVIECMAVNPMLQWISEHKMIKATHSVITNSRPDHLDQMGPTLLNVTKSLANTISFGGKLFTSEKKMGNVFKKTCLKRDTKFIYVDDSKIKNDDMGKFKYIEHKENVALALEIAKDCGVEKKEALHGMHSAFPDPGALEIFLVNEKQMELKFINAFAANDPESTLKVWYLVEDEIGMDGFNIIVLNTRSDRFFRTEQLLIAMKSLNYDKLIIVGDETENLNKVCENLKFDIKKIDNLGNISAINLFTYFYNLGKAKINVVGIGNIHGIAEPFVKYLRKKRVKDW